MHTDDFVDGRSVGGWRLKLLGDEGDDWDEVTIRGCEHCDILEVVPVLDDKSLARNATIGHQPSSAHGWGGGG